MDIRGKKILIMGGNAEGMETIRNANDMGLKTIVVDPDPASPGKKIAWKSYDVNAIDLEALLAICREEKVDGVMVGLSERLLMTYSRLCGELGLPRYCTPEQLAVFCDKIAFKNKCREYGIPVVRDYTPEDEIPYPVLVKPADSSGSKGISVCRNREELLAAVERARSYSHTDRYLIEDFLEGDQLSVIYTVVEGTPYLSLISDRYVVEPVKGLGTIAAGVVYPSKYAEQYVAEIHPKVCRMLKDLKVENAPFNIQAFVDDGVIRFYDPAIRVSGGRVYLLTERMTGLNIQKSLLYYAVTGKMFAPGETVQLKEDDWKLEGKYSVFPNPMVRTGTIARIEVSESLKDIPELLAYFLLKKEGDKVTLAGTGQQMAVRLSFLGDTLDAVIDAYRKAYDCIHITDEQGENMMLPAFDFRTHYPEQTGR